MNGYSWLLVLCLAPATESSPERSIAGTAKPTVRRTVPHVEAAELLERIAGQLKQNYDKIGLWKGAYRIATVTQTEHAYVDGQVDTAGKKSPSRRLNGRFHFHSEDMAEFFLDIPRDSLLSRYARIGQPYFRAIVSGQVIKANSTKGHQQWCILTNGRYLEFTPDRRGYVDLKDIPLTTSAVNSRVVVNEDPAKGVGRANSSDLVDPRKLFEFGSVRFDEQMKMLAKQCRAGNTTRLAVFISPSAPEPGAQVRIEERMGESGEELVVHQLEEAFGFHPTMISLTVPRAITFRNEWSYSQKEGVFVPETWLDEQRREDGSLVRRRTMRLVESEFPRELVGVTFTAADFHVRDGDLFVDKIEQKNYRFRDGTPVPAAEFIRSQRGKSNRWLLISSVLGGCSIVILFVVRAWRRQGATEGR